MDTDKITQFLRKHQKEIYAVLFLGLLAFFFRIYAISWGMPLKYAHIDESVVLFYALRVLAGEPNPQVFFDYPSLFLYLLSFVFRVVLFLSNGVHFREALEEQFNHYLAGDPLFFTLTGRYLNVVLGVLTVLFVYHLGKKWGNQFIGCSAGALFACHRLHLLHCHYVTVDVLTVLLALLAIDRIVDYWLEGFYRDALWSGFLVGLAAATKYYPGILAVFILIALIKHRKKILISQWVSVLALMGVGFVIGNPFSLFSFQEFWGRFMHLFPKIVGTDTLQDSDSYFKTVFFLLKNMGYLGVFSLCVGIFGIFRIDKNNPFQKLFFITIGLLFFLSCWKIQSEHYSLLLYPISFIFIASGTYLLRRVHPFLPVIAIFIIGIFYLPSTFKELKILSEKDTRLKLKEWIKQEIPPDKTFLRFAHTPEFTRKDPYVVKVDWENKLLKKDSVAFKNLVKSYDYIIYSSYSLKGDKNVEKLSRIFDLVKKEESQFTRFPHHPHLFLYANSKNLKEDSLNHDRT